MAQKFLIKFVSKTGSGVLKNLVYNLTPRNVLFKKHNVNKFCKCKALSSNTKTLFWQQSMPKNDSYFGKRISYYYFI